MRMVGEFDVNAVHKFLMGYRMCVPGCLLLCLAFREPFSLQIRREDNIFCVFLSILFHRQGSNKNQRVVFVILNFC